MAENDRHGKIPPKKTENLKRELFGIDGAESPEGGRFKPGQSGNPKDRPKRAAEPALSSGEHSIHAATVRLAMAPVTLKENGTSVSIPMVEAIIRAQMASAAKGNRFAQRDALLRIENARREIARDLAEKHEFWGRHRDQQWAEIERAKRNGTPMPNPLPHPDDVVIESGRALRIDGPIDEAEEAQCKESCRFRDALLLQDALDERFEAEQSNDGYRAGGAQLIAVILNHSIPKRFRLSENDLNWRALRNTAIPKRQLLKAFGLLPVSWTVS